MPKFQTIKLSQLHIKQKLAGQKTVGLGGLWATFEGSFLMFFRRIEGLNSDLTK